MELPALTPPTHKRSCMDMHFTYKLCLNAVDVYSQKYYFQSPAFTARQTHRQHSLHGATVTPFGSPPTPAPSGTAAPAPAPIRATHQEAELQRDKTCCT